MPEHISALVNKINALLNGHSIPLDATVEPSALTLDVMKLVCAMDLAAVKKMQDALRKSNICLDLHGCSPYPVEYVGVYMTINRKSSGFHFMPFITEKFEDDIPYHFYAMSFNETPVKDDRTFRILHSATRKLGLLPRVPPFTDAYREAFKTYQDDPEVQEALKQAVSRPDLLICGQGSGVSASKKVYLTMNSHKFVVFGSCSYKTSKMGRCIEAVTRIPLNEFLNVNLDTLSFSDNNIQELVNRHFTKIKTPRPEGFVPLETHTFSFHDDLAMDGHVGACYVQKVIVEKKFTLLSEFLKWYLIHGPSVEIKAGSYVEGSMAVAGNRYLPGTWYPNKYTRRSDFP